jgi:threonine dehydrogenase-like Zn-dependent dehydrogenase
MRRAVWTENGLEVQEADPDDLLPGWVRLTTEACGICGSDLANWSGARPPALGTAPGHEFVGRIEDGAAGISDGRYAVTPIITCGTCRHCERREWNLCRRGGDLLGLGRDGGLADWVDVPATNLVRLDDDVDPILGMLTEPTAVGVRAANIATLDPDDRAVVIGAGTIGLVTAAMARLRIDDVTICARHPHQAEAARALGLEVIDEADLRTWGKTNQPTVVFDSVGGASGDTLATGLDIVRRGGRIVVVGTFERVPVDLSKAMLKEVAILSSYAYGTTAGQDDFVEAARRVTILRPVVETLVTHRFDLTDVTDAFRTAGDKSARSIKVAVTTGGSGTARPTEELR